MPGLFITAKDIATGAVTFQKARYDQVTGKAREVRVPCVFITADVPYSFPHALGRVPVGWRPGPTSRNGGAPGVVYDDGVPIQASRDSITFKCSTPNTFCDVTVW